MSMFARSPQYPLLEQVQRDCVMNGHDWQVFSAVQKGPIRVVCDHCGQDSGLRRARYLEPSSLPVYVGEHAPPEALLDAIARVVGTEFPPLKRIRELLVFLHIRGLIRWTEDA